MVRVLVEEAEVDRLPVWDLEALLVVDTEGEAVREADSGDLVGDGLVDTLTDADTLLVDDTVGVGDGVGARRHALHMLLSGPKPLMMASILPSLKWTGVTMSKSPSSSQSTTTSQFWVWSARGKGVSSSSTATTAVQFPGSVLTYARTPRGLTTTISVRPFKSRSPTLMRLEGRGDSSMGSASWMYTYVVSLGPAATKSNASSPDSSATAMLLTRPTCVASMRTMQASPAPCSTSTVTDLKVLPAWVPLPVGPPWPSPAGAQPNTSQGGMGPVVVDPRGTPAKAVTTAPTPHTASGTRVEGSAPPQSQLIPPPGVEHSKSSVPSKFQSTTVQKTPWLGMGGSPESPQSKELLLLSE